jgi:hypothetical protein
MSGAYSLLALRATASGWSPGTLQEGEDAWRRNDATVPFRRLATDEAFFRMIASPRPEGFGSAHRLDAGLVGRASRLTRGTHLPDSEALARRASASSASRSPFARPRSSAATTWPPRPSGTANS